MNELNSIELNCRRGIEVENAQKKKKKRWRFGGRYEEKKDVKMKEMCGVSHPSESELSTTTAVTATLRRLPLSLSLSPLKSNSTLFIILSFIFLIN